MIFKPKSNNVCHCSAQNPPQGPQLTPSEFPSPASTHCHTPPGHPFSPHNLTHLTQVSKESQEHPGGSDVLDLETLALLSKSQDNHTVSRHLPKTTPHFALSPSIYVLCSTILRRKRTRIWSREGAGRNHSQQHCSGVPGEAQVGYCVQGKCPSGLSLHSHKHECISNLSPAPQQCQEWACTQES